MCIYLIFVSILIRSTLLCLLTFYLQRIYVFPDWIAVKRWRVTNKLNFTSKMDNLRTEFCERWKTKLETKKRPHLELNSDHFLLIPHNHVTLQLLNKLTGNVHLFVLYTSLASLFFSQQAYFMPNLSQTRLSTNWI